MSKARNNQEGGTREVLKGTKGKLDAIANRESQSAENPAPAAAKPQRVRKTISVSVDTVLAIKKIQEQRLINDGKSPTDSALIDEAIMELLRSSNLSL